MFPPVLIVVKITNLKGIIENVAARTHAYESSQLHSFEFYSESSLWYQEFRFHTGHGSGIESYTNHNAPMLGRLDSTLIGVLPFLVFIR